MADPPLEPGQQMHSPPERSRPVPPVRPYVPRPTNADPDSLSTILGGIRKLAGDLRQELAYKDYADHADELANRLERIMSGPISKASPP